MLNPEFGLRGTDVESNDAKAIWHGVKASWNVEWHNMKVSWNVEWHNVKVMLHSAKASWNVEWHKVKMILHDVKAMLFEVKLVIVA